MKRFEQSNGLDIALCKNYVYLFLCVSRPMRTSTDGGCISISYMQTYVQHKCQSCTLSFFLRNPIAFQL